MKYKEIAYILSCLVFLILTIIAGIHIVTITGWASADYIVALLITGMAIQILKG